MKRKKINQKKVLFKEKRWKSLIMVLINYLRRPPARKVETVKNNITTRK